MQTLFDKVTQGKIDQLDALDIALSLFCHTEDCTEFTHLDPYGISLDDDNHVTLLPGSRPVDCLYAAPDVVLDGTPPSRESMRFSIGCLMFFMMNGKSYCDAYDLDPIELAETTPGRSLVDPDRYNGRASDIMAALTSWNPEDRTEGIVRLLNLVEHVPATMILNYTLDGQVVYSEQINVSENMQNYRSGEVIVSENRVAYTVLPGAEVPFRPGQHTVNIPVSITSPEIPAEPPVPHPVDPPMPAQQKPAWLVMTFPTPDNPDRITAVRILPMNETAQEKPVPVSLLNKTTYRFLALDLDESGRPVRKQELFSLNIPADPNLKRAFLKIRYHVRPRGFSVVLCRQDGTILSNAQHFKMR